MSLKTWSTSVTFQSALNNFFQGSALSISHQRTQAASSDTGFNTIDIDSGSYQDLYKTQDNTAGAPAIVYLYVQSLATNQDDINIVYRSASAEITIARLKPGDWMYMPYRPQGSAYNSSWVRAYNLSAVSESSVAVLFGESGSFA